MRIKKINKVLLFSGILVIFILSCFCKQRINNKSTEKKPEASKKVLIETNKYLVKKDAELIQAYAERRGWDIKSTENGLWYMIINNGNGQRALPEQQAVINYKIELLDGTLCYSSDSSGVKKFTIGKDEVIKGLDTGIKMLNEGSKAVFIIPPYLAHGLIGDTERIPARSIIVYYVELIKIIE